MLATHAFIHMQVHHMHIRSHRRSVPFPPSLPPSIPPSIHPSIQLSLSQFSTATCCVRVSAVAVACHMADHDAVSLTCERCDGKDEVTDVCVVTPDSDTRKHRDFIKPRRVKLDL